MKYFLLRKQLTFLGLFCLLAMHAQNSFQLPDNTVLYMEMNGKQLNNKVNWAKFNPVFKEVFNKKDKSTIWNDYSKTGVKYDEKQIHYFVFNDSVKSYSAHFILDDEKRFVNFINSAKKEGLEITQKTKYSYVSINKNTFIAWNGKHAVLKTINYTKPYSHEDDASEVDSAVAVEEMAVDSVAVAPYNESGDEEVETEEQPFDYKEEIQYLEEELDYYKNTIKESQAEVEKIKKNIQYLKKHHQYPVVKPELEEKIIEESEANLTPSDEDSYDAEDDEGSDNSIFDEEYQNRIDSSKLEEYKIARELLEQSFDEIFNSNFMIEVPDDIIKFKDAKSDVFAYTNFGGIFKNMGSFGPMGSFGIMQKYIGKMYDADSSYNLYFENDKVKLVTNYQHKDPVMQKSISDIYKGKTSRKLSKLLSDKSIGYFAMNINGYKTFDATYDLIENMAESQEYQKEISVMVETMKIVLDEKAISKIMPGNAIFILNDLTSKKVEYSDYEYDDDYNEKEVKKTKEVAIPNFTFAFITENENYWNRAFDMISSNKKTAEHFVKRGDYYEFTAKDNSEIDRLLFTVKDGIVYITTSLENIVEKSQSTDTKKLAREVSRHSLSGWLDAPKLVKGLEKEFNDRKDKEMFHLVRKNIGKVTYKIDVDSESIRSEMNYNINNSSENSLMYFFDLFDEAYKIMGSKEATKTL
ncbi:hypothetical protein FNJ88_06135 [Chryseobacterium sp. SNU WT5]|uniref:hypothetical protein n=1 Tax=Chryseobacterium sp. SNU WT5 TaxID=2594269 RepID=UPI00117E11D7|nr:hypothetical protein [Chryseobacterium sp. SNU WT5]QDP85162.1 hypothetical protein FNJ88_06135 [Chryseobacterium sp. SNU WT5]